MNPTDVAHRLEAAGARTEALAVLKRARRFLPSQPTLVPVGRAWRLGVLLLGFDGSLYATGYVTRAIEPKNFNSDKTVAGEARREEQRAAARGPFARGETVNYGFEALDLAAPAHPLAVVDGTLVVLGQYAPVPLTKYLSDHAALLIEQI